MNKKEQIRKTLEELQKHLDFLESHGGGLRSLDDVSKLEKQGAFNELFAQCYKHAAKMMDEGYADEDGEYYIYEAAMRLTLGKDVWDTINPFL